MQNGINMLKDEINKRQYPDVFPKPRRLLRTKICEHAMEVSEKLEELVRDLPEMDEALRTIRMERNSPPKHSVAKRGVPCM